MFSARRGDGVGGRLGRSLRCAALASVAIALVVAAGCARASAPQLEGTWAVTQTPGQPAALSDLTLGPDGQFTYSGKNAYGAVVELGGSYTLGSSGGKPWIRLSYTDNPNVPTIWNYQLETNKLTVSPAAGSQTNGPTLVFTRK